MTLHNRISRYGSVGLAVICIALCFAQLTPAERLPVKTYTVADGLLRDSVTKIRQDSRGFLWLCSAEGISRFDGYAFTNFTTADGLPDRHVNDFLEAKSGQIYLATDKGLARLNPKGVAGSTDNPLFTVILPDRASSHSIQILFEDANRLVWVGTNDGLYTLTESGTLESVDLGNPLPDTEKIQITAMMTDRRGDMWIGTSANGLFRVSANHEVARFTVENGLPGNTIASLLEDKTGRIWVGMGPGKFEDGLCLLVPDPRKDQNLVERIFRSKDGLPSSWILALYEDKSDDKFWIATTKGLCEWQGGETSVCKTYTAKNDLCDQDIWTITADNDNNLWLGTRCGVKKWGRYGFTSYSESDGIGFPIINSIFENLTGELFASFSTGTSRFVSRFDGNEFGLIKPRFPDSVSYSGWGWKQTVLQDHVGDWWFPTGNGLYRFPNGTRFDDLSKTTPEKIETGAISSEVFRIFEDTHGDIWIATTGVANELLHWERATNVWRNLTRDLGLEPERLFTAFVEDKAGNLWIGTGSDSTGGALVRYRDGQFKIYRTAEGIPSGWMRDAFIDHLGRLWIANPSAGLLRFDELTADHLTFVDYTAKEGLSSIGVLSVTEDEYGRIYAGTGRGLDRIDPETGQIENFTTADGLPDSTVDVAYRDRNNNLWFGTSSGLAHYIPEPARQRKSPIALITGLRVNGESQSVSILGETEIAPLELGSDQEQLGIDFLGLATSLGEKLRYEYRFGGSDWTSTNERTVNFANLGSGTYKFEVRAQTADRIFSQPATVSFQIASPLWRRWWFVAGVSAILAFLVYGLYRYRLSRYLELERMRTRIAADLHDDIGANLTRISLLSEVARQKSSHANNGMLSSIADIARESVASMNDIVWAISPEHDRLLDLTRRMRQHAEEICETLDLELSFNAPSADSDLKLSAGVRRDVLLIFKEAVNNAARHSGCTKIQIDFRCEHSVLALRITDDGSGFDFENRESGGQGIRSMMRRSQGLGGSLKIDSRNGHGTKVEFESSL